MNVYCTVRALTILVTLPIRERKRGKEIKTKGREKKQNSKRRSSPGGDRRDTEQVCDIYTCI